MLVAHAESPEHVLSVRQLATAGGYGDNTNATYSQYGALAKKLVLAMGDAERWLVWTHAIGMGFRSEDHELFWQMHPPLFEALVRLGWCEDLRAGPLPEPEGATEREALALARLGQGAFRLALVREWGSCAVTDVSQQAVLRASHIKPWKDSSDRERLDPNNGLLLSAHLDALFDAGLITFGVDGRIQLSPLLSDVDRTALGITGDMVLRHVKPERMSHLQHHRENVFRP